jgi:hypothetical protein
MLLSDNGGSAEHLAVSFHDSWTLFNILTLAHLAFRTAVAISGASDWCPSSSVASDSVQLLWRSGYVVVATIYG